MIPLEVPLHVDKTYLAQGGPRHHVSASGEYVNWYAQIIYDGLFCTMPYISCNLITCDSVVCF